MLNQVVIAGRISDIKKEMEGDKKVVKIVVAVPRSYKNVEGTYDTDFITCVLFNGIADTTLEYCNKGDIVGVKGRIQTNKKLNVNSYDMEIVAEKISFLSSKKSED